MLVELLLSDIYCYKVRVQRAAKDSQLDTRKVSTEYVLVYDVMIESGKGSGR
jgi:hypothetical protein